jgi:CAAX prenyl protease-like protein
MKVDAGATLRESARVVLWGVALFGVVQGVGFFLAQNHTGAVIAQVIIAEFGTGRLGVAWSDPLAALPTGRDLARRALRGAMLGAGAGAVLLGVSVMARASRLEVGVFGLSPLLVGLLMSVLAAARDELLLRGLVLRALGPSASVTWRLLACGAAGAAYRFGIEEGVTKRSLAFAALSSMALASLWIRDRGAWLAVGANAAFMFVTGPLAAGALLDVRSPGDLDGSWVALACGAAFAASGVFVARARPVRMQA